MRTFLSEEDNRMLNWSSLCPFVNINKTWNKVNTKCNKLTKTEIYKPDRLYSIIKINLVVKIEDIFSLFCIPPFPFKLLIKMDKSPDLVKKKFMKKWVDFDVFGRDTKIF